MSDASTIRDPHTALRVGGWLPTDPRATRSYVADILGRVDPKKKLLPSVQGLADLIEGDPKIKLLAEWMIRQVPAKYKYDPTGGPEIRDVETMLSAINEAIQHPPPFNEKELVGFPVNAILDWSMGTAAGSMFYLLPEVNAAFKEILDAWCDYLDSPASLEAFVPPRPDNWGSEKALEKIRIDQFQHTGEKPPWSFTSWNDFFTREFKDGMRPVADPDDDWVIVSACESTPFSIQNGVTREDRFWIKSQPYSLEEMLDGRYVDDFVYGTVYQAFLDAFSYHRWHAPVSGTIVEARRVPGTYYAEAISEGLDPGGPNLSQGYIAHLATRAIIIFENKHIGLVAMVQVGMAECSSVQLKRKDEKGQDVDLEVGDEVEKGDQVGYFQFGGSSYCLLFQKDVIESFELDAIPGVENMNVDEFKHRWPLWLNSKLATACKKPG